MSKRASSVTPSDNELDVRGVSHLDKVGEGLEGGGSEFSIEASVCNTEQYKQAIIINVTNPGNSK